MIISLIFFYLHVYMIIYKIIVRKIGRLRILYKIHYRINLLQNITKCIQTKSQIFKTKMFSILGKEATVRIAVRNTSRHCMQI